MFFSESSGLKFDSSWGLGIFSLSHVRDKTKKHFSLKKEMYRKSRPSRGSLNSISFVLETKISYSSDETTINKLNIKKLNDFIFSFPSGKSGQKTFPSKRFLARGGQVEEGVTVATYRSTYFWEPVQHTNFTVTIVVKDGDKDETLDTQTIPSGKPKHHWKRCKLSERY